MVLKHPREQKLIYLAYFRCRCADVDENPVSSSECAGQTVPASGMTCNTVPCVGYVWQVYTPYLTRKPSTYHFHALRQVTHMPYALQKCPMCHIHRIFFSSKTTRLDLLLLYSSCSLPALLIQPLSVTVHIHLYIHSMHASSPCTHAGLAICQVLWPHAQDSICEEHV